MLNANDPAISDLLSAWHESERADFERNARALVYDDYAAKTAHERRKYLALDRGSADGTHRSGVYLVDRQTGDVFTIKGYGVPNRRVGTVATLTAHFNAASAVTQ